MEGTLMKRVPSPQQYPWLVYKHGKKDEYQTFCDILDSGNTSINRRRIPVLQNKTIFGCCFGWVVLCDNTEHYSLWNPTSLETIDLPPLKLKHNQYIANCLLTASPDHVDAKILLFGNFHSIVCCQLQLGLRQWTEIGYYNQIKSLKTDEENYFLRHPIICNGKIYAISRHYPDLLLIQLHGSDSLTVSFQVKLPRQEHLHNPRTRDYLVESLGEVYFIAFCLGGVEESEVTFIEVFKLEFSSNTWLKVTSAQDRVFFLGYYNISCGIHTSSVQGSRVYFTREGKTLYSYNIEDQSILVSLPCPDLPTPYDPYADWIMPDISRLAQEGEGKENKDLLISGRESASKEKAKEATKEVEQINLQDLPWLILKGIARHLTLVDYMNFRVVCKAFCSVAPRIHWKTELAGVKSVLLSPWLLFPENNKRFYHLVDSRLNNRYLLSMPDSLRDTSIRYSKDGWLLMSRYCSVKLFNPFTKDVIELPDMWLSSGDTLFTLTSSPSTPGCRIIGVSLLYTQVDISIISPQQQEWEFYDIKVDKPLERTYNNPVCFGGVLYFLNEKGTLEVLNIDHQVTWKSLDKPRPPSVQFYYNYLLECDGNLLAVFVGKLGNSVNIYKLDFSKLVWEKVTDLKNYALYLSRSLSFSVKVEMLDMANRIYFPRFHNRGMVFYSLNTCKFHAFGFEYSWTDFCNTSLQLNCGWIQPNWCKY